MRPDVVKRVALAGALVGGIAMAALVVDATAGPASSHREGSTEEIVAPVASRVRAVGEQVLVASTPLRAAMEAKTVAERGRLRALANEDLAKAIRILGRIPAPLPSILNSAFARAKLASMRALVARARRSLTKANGLPDARSALKAALGDARLLLRYLDLTVVEITSTFEFPVTSYRATLFGLQTPKHSWSWSNTNDCGEFGSERAKAFWSHPDSDLPGACPREEVHPSVIQVVVESGGFKCTGLYRGGSAPGIEDSPAVNPCEVG
jgi:hypothetical protein